MNNLSEVLHVKCPRCQQSLVWDNKNIYRPFCSKQCQLIDFGEWATEQHTIAGDTLELEE